MEVTSCNCAGCCQRGFTRAAENTLALGPWQDEQKQLLAGACSAALLRAGTTGTGRKRPSQHILSFSNYLSNEDVAVLREPAAQLTVKLDRRSTPCVKLRRHGR